MNFNPSENLKNTTLDKLLLYLEGSLSQEEQEQIEQLLESNEEYQRVFTVLRENYTSEPAKERTPTMDASWNTIMDRIEPHHKWYLSPAVISFSAAAAIVIAFFSGWFINQFAVSERTIMANEHQFIADTLENGGIVYLYPSSTMNTKSSKRFKDGQLVQLEGNAFFNLPNSEEMQLVLESGGSKIRLKGSSFRINTSDSGQEVSIQVEDGLCEITVDGRESEKMLVNAGEKAYFNTKDFTLRKEKPEDDIYLIYQPQL
jgi:ferric-dicitrate binding protein FerR (iron transport regulator)